ncbi:hypothetical protein M3Y95_00201900 [Aphelenchoides besseyi]|nr:hypothetical protein M3Y95_00201900 [Aphelenchoides besseyi]
MNETEVNESGGCFSCLKRNRQFVRTSMDDKQNQSSRRKQTRIERLVGLSLLLMLRYAVPKAQSQEDHCNVDEPLNVDDLMPRPRLECAQGVFDAYERHCNCDYGWSGIRCDVCTEKPCIRKSRITAIEPRYAAVEDVKLIDFVGHGFPRTPENRYHCVFNTTKTEGSWQNPNRVKCSQPPELNFTLSYDVALVPFGLQRVIRHENPVYFEFYERCNPTVCIGTCFEGLCICSDGQTSESCNGNMPSNVSFCVENRTLELDVVEYKAFNYQVPNQSNDEIISFIASSQQEILFDQLTRQIQWSHPLGSTQANWIDYKIENGNCTEYVHANIRVTNSYVPYVTSVSKHKDSNLHRVNGYIKFNQTKELSKYDLPVTLKILEGDRLVEQVSVQSKRRFFTYTIPAYLSTHRDYVVMVEHPNPISNLTSGLSFTQCVLDARYDENLSVENEELRVQYEITSETCACGQWSVQILWPRESFRLHSQSISGDNKNPTVTLAISMDRSIRMHYNNLYVAIVCDLSATFTARHNLIYANPNPIVIRPARIDVIHNNKIDTPTSFVEVKVETSNQQSANNAEPMDSDSPFFLIAVPTIRPKTNRTIELCYLFGIKRLRSLISSATGTLLYPNSQNPLFSIPYEISFGVVNEYEVYLHVRSSSTSRNKNVEVFIANSAKTENYTRSALVNSVVKFRLPTDGVYELTIIGDDFLPFVDLLKITLQNSSFTATLTKRPNQFVVLNDGEVSLRSVGESNEPQILMQPAIIKQLDVDIWVTFSYVNGPLHSIAMLKQPDNNHGALQILNLPVNVAICSGCAFRHRIRIVRNEKSNDFTQTVHLLQVPFIYTIHEAMQDYEYVSSLVFDGRTNFTDYSALRVPNNQILQSTHIYLDCAPILLQKCKDLYRQVDRCSDVWSSYLNSRVPSMQTFMQLVLYKRDCALLGIEQSEISNLLRCIISANIGACQIERQLNDKMLKCSLKSPSLALKDNLLNSIATKFKYPRYQLCRFINEFYRFLFYLNMLLPSSTATGDFSSFSRFLTTVVNGSSRGAYLTLAESLTIQPSTSEELTFISNWNKLFEELEQNTRDDGRETTKKLSILDLLQTSLDTIAELNDFSRTIANKTVPKVLNEILVETLNYRNRSSRLILIAEVHVEPRCFHETHRLHVTVYLSNPTVDITIEGLILNLGFVAVNSTQIGYRISPPIRNGRFVSTNVPALKPQQNTSVSWTAIPQFDFPLTQNLLQKAIVGISYEVGGVQRVKEVQSRVFQIEPTNKLRTLVFLNTNITTKTTRNPNAFSVMLIVINIGYSTIKNVQLHQIRPQIVDPFTSEFVVFSIDTISVDENPRPPSVDINLGALESGEIRQIKLNVSTESTPAHLQDLTVTPTTNNRFPDIGSLRTFTIRKQIRETDFLVAEVSASVPLYLFETQKAKLTSLQAVFPTQQEPQVRERNDCRKSVIVAFKSAEPQSQFDGPIIGTVNWPKTIQRHSHRIIGIFQVFPNFDVLQRSISSDYFWTNTEAMEELTFVDTQPFTAAHRIFYELVFSSTESRCSEESLFFLQDSYRISSKHIDGNQSTKPLVSIAAQIYPLHQSNNEDIAYELLSRNQLSYVVVPETGLILNIKPPNVTETQNCAILRAYTKTTSANTTIIFDGNGYEVDCTNEINTPPEHLQRHIISAHDLPFDFKAARDKFLDALKNHNLENFFTDTTTVLPNDEWTDEFESYNDKMKSTTTSTSDIMLQTIGFITPHQTPPTLHTTTTSELMITPDITLTSFVPSTTTDVYSMTSDYTLNSIQTTASGAQTTQNEVVVANVGPQLETQHPEEANNHIVTMLAISTPPSTSPLPVATLVPVNNRTFSSATQLAFNHDTTSAEMVDMACKMRTSKPMFSVLCDLARSVYRSQ